MFDTNAKKGCYVIDGLKTNRIFYPQGIKQSLTEFAPHMKKSDTYVGAIKNGLYRVYLYGGKLNNIYNAVVIIHREDGKVFYPSNFYFIFRHVQN